MAKEPTQLVADDPQKPSQLEPYPTGNPPDPMEEYYKAHPERKLEVERAAAEAEKAEKAEKKSEPKVEPKAKPEPEEDDNNFRKGRK